MIIEKPKKTTHKQRILEHFLSGKSLMRVQAFKALGLLDPSTRISDLKADGHNIVTEMVKVRDRYGDSVTVAKWTLLDDNDKQVKPQSMVAYFKSMVYNKIAERGVVK